MADDEPDRSALEIKHLLLKLNPKNQHKDRVRSLARFRNYASGDQAKKTKSDANFSTPVFYDDDLPLLFLGSYQSTLTDDGALRMDEMHQYTGLLSACATPSTGEGLKRSARNAMSLLKYLSLEYVEVADGEPVPIETDPNTGLPELNPFAYALCGLTVSQLRLANWETHLNSDAKDRKSGTAKDDACEILLLVLTRHFDPLTDIGTVAGGSNNPTKPIVVEELLPDAKARQALENWLVLNKPREVVSRFREKFLTKPDVGGSATASVGGGAGRPSVAATAAAKKVVDPFGDDDDEEEEEEEALNAFAKRRVPANTEAEAQAHANEQLDNLGIDLYEKKDEGNDGAVGGQKGAKMWKDSVLCKQDEAFGLAAIEREDADRRQRVSRNEEKAIRLLEERDTVMGRDPLGIRPDTFDLRTIQGRIVELLEQAIADIDEEIIETSFTDAKANDKQKKKKGSSKKATTGYNLDQLVSLEAQKDSLQAILEGRQLGVAANSYGQKDDGDYDGKEVRMKHPMSVEDLSVLPTDHNFNPLLFLTLVHRNATFVQLKESMTRLGNITDNQALRLQSLVRDNFALFIRCADGIDLFSEKGSKSFSRQPETRGVNERLDKLDSIASSCTEQAQKSFKPLLDNTSEVRKVQSAIAVLNRVGPLLQVPSMMRQHIENGRFSAAVKEYRRVLVIDDHNKIELLRHVKRKAAEAARDARRDLECRLANPTVPVQSILDSLRDLEELIELDIPVEEDGDIGDGEGGGDGGDREDPPELAALVGVTSPSVGKFKVGEVMVDVREHPPCLACLLLQAAHFSLLVKEAIAEIDESCYNSFTGDSLPAVREESQELDPYGVPLDPDEKNSASRTTVKHSNQGSSGIINNNNNGLNGSDSHSESKSTTTGGSASSDKRERNRWKYEILENRVVGTIRVVKIARTWLPRLLRIGEAARQAERRRAARVGRRHRHPTPDLSLPNVTAFEVFITHVSPSIRLLVEHGAFCSLGCYNEVDEGKELKNTFGFDADPQLQRMLTSPLPDLQSTKCATELADVADLVQSVAAAAIELRPNENDIDGGIGGNYGNKSSHFFIAMESTLEDISALVEEAVVTIERRKCIYAFDFCSKSCAIRASGGGVFDGEAIMACVQKLSDELTRPESCARDIEEGCILVVNKCCDGLDSYVNDRGRERGDPARLRTVAECASALDGTIMDVVTETEDLTNGGCEVLEEILMKRVMDLEATMFDEFLDSIRQKISTYTRLGPMEVLEDDGSQYAGAENSNTTSKEPKFPAYLSASLLAIVRCRAQVERTLGEKTIRKSEDIPYQFLAMSTAADSVVDGICYEMDQRMSQMRGSQADVYLNELQFLINTLRKYLSKELLEVAEHCREQLLSKAGAGFQGDGPDGLGAIEQLERLGRVYVLCLG